jgi:hypothetical protein
MEDYIANSLGSWLYQVGRQGLQCGSMPQNVRSYFFSTAHLAHYKRYAYDENERRFLRSVDIRGQAFHLSVDANPFPTYLRGQHLLKDRKYPSVDNLEVLFSRIGLETIFNDLSRRMRTDAALALKSFNDIRNTIAHENPPPLTFLDIERHFKDIQALISAVDRILWAYVVRWSGVSCWI